MPIAANITMVTVTGEYVDYLGAPIAGQVVFTLPKTLRNQLADQIVVPSSYTVTLNAFGQFSVQLPATDDPDFHEAFTYTITEAFTGGRTWQTTLPQAVTSVDMTDLSPAYDGGAFTELAAYQAFVYEQQRVTTQEGLISYTPAGVVMPSTYGNVDFVLDSYAELITEQPTYANLAAASSLIAQSGDILPLDDVRVNLVTNPSFETNTTGWSTLGGSTISRTTTDFYIGGASVLVTRDVAAANQGIAGTVSVTSGQPYTFSAYVKNTAGITRNMYTQIGWPGGTFSTSTFVAVAAGSWTRLSVTGTAPSSGTANLYVVTGTTAQNASGQTALVDALLMEQSSTLGSYFDGSFDGFWTGTAHASTSRNATVPSYALVAQSWADVAVNSAEALFPHPFVFTGSLRVQR